MPRPSSRPRPGPRPPAATRAFPRGHGDRRACRGEAAPPAGGRPPPRAVRPGCGRDISMSVIAHPAPIIRAATPGDFGAAGDVTELAFASGPYSHLPRWPERVRFERDVAARAADGEVLVAERDGLIVGAVSVLRAGTPFARRARDGEAELRLLAVAPDVQGGGIGRLLLAAAHEVALEWGAPALVLDTGTRNTAARRLYERHGFRRVPGRGATPGEAGPP